MNVLVSSSDIFSLGFGPFRWVCTSADPVDLAVTDNLTLKVMDDIIAKGGKFFKLHLLRFYRGMYTEGSQI